MMARSDDPPLRLASAPTGWRREAQGPAHGRGSCLGVALLAGLLTLLLSACASRMDVRGIGSGGAPPFYELRGHRTEALTQQAAVLCPMGYRVARSWQRQAPVESGAGPIAYVRNKVDDLLWPGLDDQAQLVIQCNSGLPRFEPVGLPPPPAPAPVASAPAVSRRIDVTEPRAVAAPETAPSQAAPLAALPGSAPALPLPKAATPGKPPTAKPGTKSPFSVPAAGTAGRGSM